MTVGTKLLFEMPMDHDFLCEKACGWLRSKARCDPALSGNASCQEVPDAIGWTSNCNYPGHSIVIEVKTSRSDFLADKKKYHAFTHQNHGWRVFARNLKHETYLVEQGYMLTDIPRMGGHRYYLSTPDVISIADIQTHAPDHGLLHWTGRKIIEVLAAPLRRDANYASETRYLRFALTHLASNFLAVGVSIDLNRATKMFGKEGIELPGKPEAVA